MANAETPELKPEMPSPEGEAKLAFVAEREAASKEAVPAAERKENSAATVGKPIAAAKAAAPEVVTRDPELMRVERVLESGLLDTYLRLPPTDRKKFKTVGEAAAAALRIMLGERGVNPSKAHDVIEDWLRTIPRVNKWFLVQVGKIKTDEFAKLVLERKAQTLE